MRYNGMVVRSLLAFFGLAALRFAQDPPSMTSPHGSTSTRCGSLRSSQSGRNCWKCLTKECRGSGAGSGASRPRARGRAKSARH
jgi:hypothetical protein